MREYGPRLLVTRETPGMEENVTGTASVDINCPIEDAFAAVSDVTRMGEWSPETTGARWVDVDGPAAGAAFAGDNEARLGPVVLKRWTTTSVVTECESPNVFAFLSGETTYWRYEFTAIDGGTRVTESFSFPPVGGLQRVLYNALGNRRKQIIRGMESTLAAVKSALES
jgi:hypothetical protein